MSLDFEKYAAKGNEIINKLSAELELPRDNAGRVMRSVLHALRNRLTIEESFQLLAQLPLVLKGVYVDGWKLTKPFSRIHYLEDFIEEVKNEDGRTADYDFDNAENSKHAIKSTFKILSYYLSEGELEDMMAVLPKALKDFIHHSVGENKYVL
ncbi:MAG: DUF2267 domain-containing protein [Ferruginibacter sp.]|nr:DUF2267 domain-containing protein [Ferruginibacter sp.]